MTSITALLMTNVDPRVRLSELDRLSTAAPEGVVEARRREVLAGPFAPMFDIRPSKMDFRTVVAGLHALEVKSSLFLVPEPPPGADWAAFGMPVLSEAEFRAFMARWEFGDVEAFLRAFAVATWWEALRTDDGRWTLIPQDSRPGLAVVVPLIVSFDGALVFDRFPIPTRDGTVDDEEPLCRLNATVQRPKRPYVGECETVGCRHGCQDQAGTTSDGNKVLLACGC